MSEEELRDRLQHEAKQQYKRVPGKKPGYLQPWSIVLISLAILLFGMLLYSFMGSNATSSQSALLGQMITETDNAKTEMQAHATSNIGLSSITPTALVRTKNPGLAQPLSQIRQYFPAIIRSQQPCLDEKSTAYEIVTGPVYTPALGTQLANDQDIEITITWTVKNTGKCNWVDIWLWSLHTGQLVRPVLVMDGVVVEIGEGSLFILKPGEKVEVVIHFEPEEAEDVDEEWVFKINTRYLLTKPHLDVQVDNWIIMVEKTEMPRIKKTPVIIYPPGIKPSIQPPSIAPTQDPANPPSGRP
jgi:hypothetical protein